MAFFANIVGERVGFISSFDSFSAAYEGRVLAICGSEATLRICDYKPITDV